VSNVRQLSPLRRDLPIVSSSFTPELIADVAKRAQEHLDSTKGFEVTNDADAQLAADGMAEIAATKKELDATRKAFLEPVNAEHDRIQSPFKAAMDLCDKARKALEEPTARYQLAKRAAQQKAMREATAAAATGNAPALTTALNQVQAAAPTKTVGVSFSAYWVAEVFAPDLVPNDFLITVPDAEKIQKHATGTPPDREPTPIGGVRFRLETSSRVTGKR
jgi:hypothetical protein